MNITDGTSSIMPGGIFIERDMFITQLLLFESFRQLLARPTESLP